MEKAGKVKINVRHHRDVTIPLETKEAEMFVENLNQLIPEAKRKELMRIMKEEKLQKIAEEKLEAGRAFVQSPAIEAPILEEELEEVEEEEEQKKED